MKFDLSDCFILVNEPYSLVSLICRTSLKISQPMRVRHIILSAR